MSSEKSDSKRADHWVVEKGWAASRSQAQDLIKREQILFRGKATKPAQMISSEDSEELQRADGSRTWVSRAAEKLLAALEHFDVPVKGRRFLDVGQSTGGFTQVLLEKEATQVVGIDVGHDQLEAGLKALSQKEPHRLISISGLNAKDMKNSKEFQVAAKGGFDAAVIDVSFISVQKVIPEVLTHLKPQGTLLILFKPQFEVGPKSLTKHGVVKDAKALADAQDECRDFLVKLSLRVSDFYSVPLRGKQGNQEFFIYAIKS